MLPIPTWKSDSVESRTSPIHGRGVFAMKDLKKGTFLQAYQGITRTFPEFKALHGKDYRYTYSMRPIHQIIDGKCDTYKTANISHYCNESNNANVILRKKGLVVKRDILKDEELFLTYPRNYPRDYTLA
jgi:SET domain-containing protein